MAKIAFLLLAVLVLSEEATTPDDQVPPEPTEEVAKDAEPVPIKEDPLEKALKDLEDAEKHEFQADVSRVMDIFIHSLYTNKEIFIRETISNASDALDKLRYLAITDDSVLGENRNLDIFIEYDKDAKTLSFTDTGIGMTKDDLIKHLGTIAKSGTTQFVEALASGADLNLIGQFGVGFYSNFLAAEQIIVTSKHNDDDQHIWISKASNTFSVLKDPRGNTLGRGTRITIKLKQDATEFLDEENLRKIVKKYSEFVQYPIYLKVKKEISREIEIPLEERDEDDEKTTKMVKETVWDWERVNENKPIWLREEVEDEEYFSFYKTLSKDPRDPMSYIHFTAEGEVEFKALLYIPSTDAADLFKNIYASSAPVKLYVKRVLITEEFHDLIPRYLSFIRGVVDSDDLPLNVARENLQHTKILKLINKKITRKILQELQDIADEEVEEGETENEYTRFYKEFGKHIKLGITEDTANKGKLCKLLRFYSTNDIDKLTSLDEYISRMKDGQDDIYFIAGDDRVKLSQSPLIKKLKNQGYEVLLLDDPIDEYTVNTINEYERMHLQNVGSNDWVIPEEDEEFARKKEKALKLHYDPLIEWFKGITAGKVQEVTISRKLHEEPSIITTNGDDGQSANMERIAKAQAFGKKDSSSSPSRKTWEINPGHPIIKKLQTFAATMPTKGFEREVGDTMYDLALIQSGFSLPDSTRFYHRIQKFIAKDLGVDPGEGVSEPYVDVDWQEPEEEKYESLDTFSLDEDL
jgi:heat shock protein 90kDa beta